MLFLVRGFAKRNQRQPMFQAEFDSTPSPDTPIFLPSGIVVSGVYDWVSKMADVA